MTRTMAESAVSRMVRATMVMWWSVRRLVSSRRRPDLLAMKMENWVIGVADARWVVSIRSVCFG